MGTLPQLVEEDMQVIDAVLREALVGSEALTALLIDQGGFLIASAGAAGDLDLTSMAALASGAFMATETIAQLVHEPTFNSVYHQGQEHSLLILRVNDCCLLTLIFSVQVAVGLVKYFALPAAERIAEQLNVAQQRAPEARVDLSVLNLADTAPVFRRKT